MGRARAEQPKIEEEKKEIETAEAETAETGDKEIDAFLNGETEKKPEGAEEISIEEAKKLEEEAKANAETAAAEEVEYLIEAPNKKYTGITATVQFKEGVGKTKNKVIVEYFKERNYKISVVK